MLEWISEPENLKRKNTMGLSSCKSLSTATNPNIWFQLPKENRYTQCDSVFKEEPQLSAS